LIVATVAVAMSMTLLAPALGQSFSASRALAHIRYLSETIGVRPAGSASEKLAAQYILVQFRAVGYQPVYESFPLPPSKRSSSNVIATLPASAPSKGVVVLGAHYDSKSPSPGADDNGTGVGVLLELARVLRAEPLPFTVKLVAFGSEEMIGHNKDHHHYGSRACARRHAPRYSGDWPIVGMISIDMVGKGSTLHVRSLGLGSDVLVRECLRSAKALGVAASYSRDPSGWSDHEAFEKAGLAVAWLERLPSPGYHTKGDTMAGIKPEYLAQAGQIVLHTPRQMSR
jgi:Zn-dependent M28 family amino/carboxypeptidase